MLKMIKKIVLIVWAVLAASAISSAVKAGPNTPSTDLWSELRNEAPPVAPYVVSSPLPMEWESPSNPERKLWSENVTTSSTLGVGP